MKNITVTLFIVLCTFHGSRCLASWQVYAPDILGGSSMMVELPKGSVCEKNLSLGVAVQNSRNRELRLDNESTMGTVGFCMQMWRLALYNMYKQEEKFWKNYWERFQERPVLTINTRLVNTGDDNAWYGGQDKSLNFTFNDRNGNYMCRSFSTVAHETGHACLDVIFPRLLEEGYRTEYSRALHEAFGDITAILASMKLAEGCGAIAQYAEALQNGRLGMRLPDGVCIRNAGASVGSERFEHHHMSKPFTKAFFKMMEETVKVKRKFNSQIIHVYMNALLESIRTLKHLNNSLLYDVLSSIETYLVNATFLKESSQIADEYYESLVQHVGLPDSVVINHPVAQGAFERDNHYGSYVPSSDQINARRTPPGFERLNENIQLHQAQRERASVTTKFGALLRR